MDILHALVLGVVEGVTEFLPISSTFHLIFSSKILGVTQSDFVKLFEVFIQGGAILSVVVIYLQEVMKNVELSKKTLISFLPTAAIGFILYKVIKNVFFSADYLMLTIFVLVGVVFIFTEFLISSNRLKLTKSVKNLSYKQAFLIGVIQALAVIPGVSRAGAVMIGMMLFKFKRDEAAKYSFILAVPTILAASGYDLLKMKDLVLQQQSNMILLVIGSLTAFISSYVVIRWFIGYLKNNSLAVFGYYRFLLVIILLVFGIR